MAENLISETIYMEFANDENDKTKLSLPDPIENLDGETVSNVMETAIENGVLFGKNGKRLTVAVGAYVRKVVQTTLF